MFEIGVVYRQKRTLYLAITKHKLIHYSTRIKTTCPQSRAGFQAFPRLSVDELCQKWNIPIGKLDEITLQFLQPSQSGIKTAPAGSRKAAAEREFQGRQMRLTRIAM
jgi:hypothetical protein